MPQRKSGTDEIDPVKKDSFTWFWDGLEDYLTRHSLKQTRQRELIVSYFLKMNKHVAAEDLHETVRGAGHNIGLATIYRTLNLLSDAGLAEQKNFTDGRAVYEVNEPGEHHDHLVCLGCGLIIEFENEEIERLQETIAAYHGFRLESHRLDMFGTCRECQKK